MQQVHNMATAGVGVSSECTDEVFDGHLKELLLMTRVVRFGILAKPIGNGPCRAERT